MRISLIILLAVIFTKLNAQVLFPGYHLSEYYDILRMKNKELIDPITLHPSIIHAYATDSVLSWDLWDGRFDVSKKKENYIEVINPYAKVGYSSAFPDSYNDGAVWEGKGFNSSINFGFTGKKGILSYTFSPVIYMAQNKDFYIAKSSPYTKNKFSYPFEEKIDWVTRYGDKTINQFNLGQSEVRLTYKKVTIGVSTQSMVWGGAQQAPVVMSNNAAGIPHMDIGTAIPIDTKIGKIEFRTFWGVMNESDYFDSDQTNDQRYFTGAIFGYEPKYFPGLSLGINRVLYRDMFDGDFKLINVFAALWGNISNPELPNDDYDQMMSLMVRWKFKEYGFNTYVEFTRNDYSGTFVDLLENPERTRGVTMGFIKTVDLNNGNLIKIGFEHTKLNKIRMASATTGHPTYYVHTVVDNGYTHQGQIIGAYIGPGSNANHIRIQYYSSQGRISLNFDRVRFNDDYFISKFAGDPKVPNDTRFRVGLDYLRFVGPFSLDFGINSGYRRNWYYESDRDTRNLTISLKVGYLLNKKTASAKNSLSANE